MSESVQKRNYEEKTITPKSGFKMLAVTIISSIIALAALIVGAILMGKGIETVDEIVTNVSTTGAIGIVLLCVGILYYCLPLTLLCIGFKIVSPNEAIVLVLFGKYKGTIVKEGFFWVNPFATSYNPGATPTEKTLNGKVIKVTPKKLSLKAMTLNNERQKVNDEEGNPIEIGVVVIWKIINTAKAVFNVENYSEYISTQADAAIRQVARKYPYDVSDAGDEKSLRGSTQEIAETLRAELQEKVQIAGIEILEARIAHLAYAPEIASAMLQRQQASAVIAARQKIVEGAVGMVEMALNKLNENNVCNLDDERKAAMVSNLLVVLCGNKEAQPIVNSGTIY